MNLILLEPGEIDASGLAVLTGARARHIERVLHAVSGSQLRIGVVDGPRGVAAVESVDSGTVALRCRLDGERPPLPPVDLLLALPRPKVMRRLWAQLAALGVGHIMLTNADKVERDYFDAHTLLPEHYRPLLIEGLQQARDTRLPRVTIHRQFRVLVEDLLAVGSGFSRIAESGVSRIARVVADPSAAASIQETLRPHRDERVLLAVGPEGGWNTFELDLLNTHGFESVSMGTRTLRSDTACVALIAITHSAIRGT